MKRLLLIAGATLAIAGCGNHASSDIATVNITRIKANWPKFINYSNQLAADANTIDQARVDDRQKQQQRARLQQRAVDMQNEVANDVRSASEQVATAGHYKLVVTREFVGYGGVDITADVEKILKITEKSPSP